MKREMRIYILKGVKIDLDNPSKSEYNSLIKVHAFFTNLKELYNNFDSDTIQSYSTIASHIQKDGFYRIREGKYLYEKSFKSFNEITITRALVNQMYYKRTSISLSDLILKEANRISEEGFTIFK